MTSYFDMINAIDFAHNCALEYQYQYFLKKYPHIFKHVHNQTRQATHKDYYIPASISHECKVFAITFNEIGCNKVGCFPKTNTLTDCTENDPTSFISIGKNFYLSCQPACHEISKSIDTEFIDGKCWQMNTEKKIFALFPEKIHGLEIYQPMHKGLDIQNRDLAINEDYCTAFGLSFENNECIAPVGQEIGEFFLGSTVYKSIKQAINVSYSQTKTPPAVPQEVLNLNNWLEGSPRMQKTSSYTSNQSMPHIPKETLSAVYNRFFKDIALDIGVDLSMDHTLRIMKKRIPNSVMKLSNVTPKIVQSAMMKALVQSQLLTVAQVSKGLLSALSKTNVLLSVFGVISSLVDIFDPFNYNYVLDKETISKVNEHLDYTFYRSNNREIEITPEKIWNLLEDNMDPYVEKMEEKIDHYLKAVALEDYSTRFKIQRDIFKKKMTKTHFNWHKVFHIFFVMILIILSLVFVQYIAYFLLIYFIFILFNKPAYY